MRILIITQNEPFYLSNAIGYLLRNVSSSTEIVGCCLFDVSPYGKRESFIDKALKTLRIFGFVFFCVYSWRYVVSRFRPGMRVRNILEAYGVPIIKLDKPVNDPPVITSFGRFQA